MKLADMTFEDLRLLIAEIVDEQLRRSLMIPSDQRSVDEVLAAMDALRWTPPENSPSTTELLRGDRER